MDPKFHANVSIRYRDHVMDVLGYNIPAADSAAELIATAKRIAPPPFESQQGWRTEPPFPGAAERPEQMKTGWRMICACRLLAGGEELGVLYTTFVSGRPVTVVANRAGTLIPKEYSPIASR